MKCELGYYVSAMHGVADQMRQHGYQPPRPYLDARHCAEAMGLVIIDYERGNDDNPVLELLHRYVDDCFRLADIAQKAASREPRR